MILYAGHPPALYKYRAPYKGVEKMAPTPIRSLILIRNTDCKVCSLLENGVVEGVFRFVKCGEKRSTHILQPSLGKGRRRLNLSGASVYKLSGGLLLIEAPSCTACRVFCNSPCVPRQAIYIPGVGVFFSLLTPGPRVAKKIIERLAAAGRTVEVVEEADMKIPRGLTKKQFNVLLAAIRTGYLNTPRECTLSELSSALGLSKSTVYRCLKTGLKKLALDALLEYEPEAFSRRLSLIHR